VGHGHSIQVGDYLKYENNMGVIKHTLMRGIVLIFKKDHLRQLKNTDTYKNIYL